MKAPQLSAQPGSLLAWLIHRVTGESERAGCACDRRRRSMNRWGWAGCWKQRRLIIAWVLDEARARGHDVNSAHVATLFRAALLELRARHGAAVAAELAGAAGNVGAAPAVDDQR